MKYEINGKVVETDRELSEAEIDEIGQQIGGTETPDVPQQRGAMDMLKDAVAIEKQPGLPKGPMEFAKQTGQQFLEGATSLMPGSLIGTPIRAASQISQQFGADVARAVEPSAGTTGARLAGFGAATLTDPTTFIGGGMGFKAGSMAATKGLEAAAPTAFKSLANIPEEATKVLLKTKDLFKKATGSETAIEGAVKNVQDALTNTLRREGKAIQEIEDKLGVSRTVEQTRQEMLAGRGIGAFQAELQGKKATDLLTTYQQMKPALGQLTPGDKIATLRAMQQEMNGRVTNFKMVGDPMEGMLKSTAKEIAQEIKATPGGELIRAVQAKYARARNMYDGLSKLLKDEGSAEQILTNVFKSQAPRYKTLRTGLAELEKLSGEPVFTNMFQQFAAKEFNKLAGKPTRAAVGGTLMSTGAASMSFNPVLGLGQMAAGGALALSQSPRALARATQAIPGAIGAVTSPAAGLLMSLANKTKQPNPQQLRQR